jgi:aspartate aminotransferase
MPSRAQRFDNIELSLIRQISALAKPGSINLSIGEPNIEPDAHFRELAKRAAAEGSWHYTPNPGSLSLRRRIADYEVAEFDPATEVCVTAGTQEGLYAVTQAFLNPGDEVLLPDPGFLAYPVLVRLAGATPRPYRLDPDFWTIDCDDLEQQINARTKAIIVNSPSNPTGGVERESTVERLSRIAADRDLLLISDEVYREIHFDTPPPSFAGRGPNIIVANGMSKSHGMTGLRLGWLLAGQELMQTIVKAHQYIATCASAFSQLLTELVLSEEQWNGQWLTGVRARFRGQRDAAISAIERHLGVRIPPPAGAFYAFAPVPTCDSEGLARALATQAGVLTIPGVAFGKSGEGFLRLSFAASSEEIGAGIEKIGRYFDEMRL